MSQSTSWWEPKAEVESLIDFWLEQYSWRTQEDAFNTNLAESQFRTAFTSPAADLDAPALRLHFIHVRASQAGAVPLLLIPPFPFTNLSLAHLIEPLINPVAGSDGSTSQAFHVVIPSIPGLGFSDALPNNVPAISSTADMFNSLMLRLGYDHYIVTNAAPGTTSPAQIDYKLADFLASCYPDHCLGANLIAPPLAQPSLKQNPVEWAKWSVASVLKKDLFGYKTTDFSSKGRFWPVKQATVAPTSSITATSSLESMGLQEPNTLAYALCDSPTGLLVQVLKNLRTLGPSKDFTQTEILDFTQLSWLPGPEAALRFWASCSKNPEQVKSPASKRPRVAITIFQAAEGGKTSPAPNKSDATALNKPALQPSYACPAWANSKYTVLDVARVQGAPGLLAWERPGVIVDGVQRLAAGVLKSDRRLRNEASSTTTALSGVFVDSNQSTAPSSSSGNRPSAAGSATTDADNANKPQQPPTLTQSPSGHLVPPGTLAGADHRAQPQRELSDETMVDSGSGTELADLSDKKKKLSIDERLQPVRQLSDETVVSGLSSPATLAPSTAAASPVPTGPNSTGSLPISPLLPPTKEEIEEPVAPVGADKAELERKSIEDVPTAIVVTSADEDATQTPAKAAQQS